MPRRIKSTYHLLARLRLAAAFVALIAQMGLSGAAILDASSGASAVAHVERNGTNLHYAHNEADCFMCRAQHLGGSTPVVVDRLAVPRRDEERAPAAEVVAAILLAGARQHSRAPPTNV